MPAIADLIVIAVRNDHAVSPARKVMIERLKCFAAANSSGSKEMTQMLFRFCIHRKLRVACSRVLVDQFANSFKLRIPIGRRTSRQNFADLPQFQSFVVHPFSDRVVAHGSTHGGQLQRKRRRRKICKHNVSVIRIAGRPSRQQEIEILLDVRARRYLFFGQHPTAVYDRQPDRSRAGPVRRSRV